MKKFVIVLFSALFLMSCSTSTGNTSGSGNDNKENQKQEVNVENGKKDSSATIQGGNEGDTANNDIPADKPAEQVEKPVEE